MEKSSEDIASSTLCAGGHFGRWIFTAWCQKDIRLEYPSCIDNYVKKNK